MDWGWGGPFGPPGTVRWFADHIQRGRWGHVGTFTSSTSRTSTGPIMKLTLCQRVGAISCQNRRAQACLLVPGVQPTSAGATLRAEQMEANVHCTRAWPEASSRGREIPTCPCSGTTAQPHSSSLMHYGQGAKTTHPAVAFSLHLSKDQEEHQWSGLISDVLSMARSVGKELKTSREELAQVRTSLEKEKMTVLATRSGLEDQEVTWKQRFQLVSSEYAQALSDLTKKMERESCHVCRARRWDYRWSVAVHIREPLSGNVKLGTQGHELDHLPVAAECDYLNRTAKNRELALTEAAKDLNDLRMALKHRDHQVKLLEIAQAIESFEERVGRPTLGSLTLKVFVEAQQCALSCIAMLNERLASSKPHIASKES
ncbi:hypothetical protein EMCRGX_G021835 [Ephydatia muelleri]